MTEQFLLFTTTDGRTVEVPKRGKHYVQPRGYAAPPGTGPNGETCRSCRHSVRTGRGKSYPKCELIRRAWSHGRATDILMRAAACSKWEGR